MNWSTQKDKEVARKVVGLRDGERMEQIPSVFLKKAPNKMYPLLCHLAIVSVHKLDKSSIK